jgi:hypothetical protein
MGRYFNRLFEGIKMGWEKRGKHGKRLVYYRKKRVGKRVFGVYVGPGEVGERAEREDRERREVARKMAPAPSRPAEVLRGATEGATPQVVVTATTTVEEANDVWDRLYGRTVTPRKYRRW